MIRAAKLITFWISDQILWQVLPNTCTYRVSRKFCNILIIMGGGWFPKLVWPKHNMINQQVKVGVATNDKRAKCWCGTGKVGVATATPAIRHSPPMLIIVLTRALLGLWIFHRLLGGGGRLNAPPMISAPGRRRENERQRSKAREKSFRNHFGHFLAQVKIEVSRGQNSKIFPKRFSTIKSLFLKVEQRFWYHRVCLVKARRTIYTMTLKGQGQSLTSRQVRPRSCDDRNGSYCISVDLSGQYERTDTNPTSLSLFDQKLFANYGWWPRVTSNDLPRGRQCKFLAKLSITVLYDMIPLK